MTPTSSLVYKKYSFVDIQDLTLESCQVGLNEGEQPPNLSILFNRLLLQRFIFVLFRETFLFEGLLRQMV